MNDLDYKASISYETIQTLLDHMIEDGLIDTTDLDIISDCIEDDLIEMHQVTIDKTVLNECIRQYLSHHNIICNTLEERLLNKAW